MQQNDLFDSAEERLRKDQNELDIQIGVLQSKRNIIHKELVNVCQHDKKYLKDKESYFSGSYYDTAYTDYWTVCTLCGECSETKAKQHSWYG